MFSRRWIINYVLIVLIVLFTWVGNRYDVQPGYQSKPQVSGIETGSIHSIEIKTADESLSLKRDSSGWMLTAPVSWPANNVNVERLIDIVNSETDSRLDAEELDLATVGLDFPKAMLQLNDTRVLFGAINNIGERRYTMIGSTVFLLPDIHLPFITQGLTGLVDRRLLPKKLALQSLRLPGLEFNRGDDGSWQANAAEISREQAARLIGNWQGLEASRIRLYRSSGTPRQKIQARLADGQRLEFFLMSIDPEIVIANPNIGLQYHYGRDFYYQLISLRADEDTG